MATEDLQELETPAQGEEELSADSPPAVESEKDPESLPREEDEPEVEKKRGAAARIKQLTAQKYDLLRQLDYERQQRENERNKEQESPPAPEVASKPKRDDFVDEDEYLERLAEWKADEVWKKQQAKERERRQKDEQQNFFETVNRHANDTMAKGRELFTDYDEVMAGMGNILGTYDVAASFLDLDHPAEVTYYLAQNRDEAEAIARMAPTKRAVALGKIESKVMQPVKRKVSNAPDPITPVGDKAAVAKGPPENGDEYRAWRRSQRT